MMGFFRLFSATCLGLLGAFACSDDGKVLGERSQSGGSSGSGASGASSTGGASGQGGSSPTGGSSGTNVGGTTAGGSGGGGTAGGGGTGASAGDGASGSDTGGSSTGGAAGAGAGGAGGSGSGAGGSAGAGGGGTGGAQGTPCVDRTCAATEACVAYRTIGGAQILADAGVCPSYAHSEGNFCFANFAYQCVAQPRCTAGTIDCTCGTCPQGYTACRALYVAEWLDPDAKLICEQLAP